MIDHVSRRRMAQIFRQFCIGRMSNHEYEDKMWDLFYMKETEKELYDDFNADAYLLGDSKKYWLKGENRLSAEDRKYNARIILFLRSNFPYRGPRPAENDSSSSSFPTKTISLIVLASVSVYGLLFGAMTSSIPALCLSSALLLITLFSLIQIIRSESEDKRKNESDKPTLAESDEIWPFFTKEEYEYALAHPVYLSRKC